MSLLEGEKTTGPLIVQYDQFYNGSMHNVLWDKERCLKLSDQVRLSEMLGVWEDQEESFQMEINCVPSKFIH